jgi:excisionase family DNA binding protein
VAQHHEETQGGADYNEGDYLSISQAAAQLGITQSAIRQGVRTGKVKAVSHKWGTRVSRADVEKLKETAPAASNKPIVH